MIKDSLLLSAPLSSIFRGKKLVWFLAKIWRFWETNRGLILNLSFITPKRQILRDLTSNELSRVKIRQPVEIVRTCIRYVGLMWMNGGLAAGWLLPPPMMLCFCHCLSVCLRVCLWPEYLKKFCTDLYKILHRHATWIWEEVINFLGRMEFQMATSLPVWHI